MPTYDANVQTAQGTQLDSREHCCADPERLATIGRALRQKSASGAAAGILPATRAASCASKAGMRGAAKPGVMGTIPFRPRNKKAIDREGGG
jgi:hypothetical protein